MSQIFFRKTAIVLAIYLLKLLPASYGLGPTITQTGIFEGINSHQIVRAKISGNFARVCLPKFEFSSEIDDREIKKRLKEGLDTQEAIFHLYHNGLGSPKKQGGMYFASDIYLKGIKMTYTGYLRKLGLSFKISRTPPHEDKELLRGVLYNQHIVNKQLEAQKAEQNKRPEPEKEKKVSKMRVTTIWDVLPKGVIPPSIRKQQREIDARIKALKNQPYKSEIVKMHPVRWATGKMGEIKADGAIIDSYLEGQKPPLFITPPKEKNWLTAQMVNELRNQPCEFVFQLDRQGHEVFAGKNYFLRDIYFKNLKLTWEEWLTKHHKTFVDPASRKDFASSSIDLEVKLINGIFTGMRAVVLCGAEFTPVTDLVQTKEIIRVFPPNPKPNKFVAFARRFNQLFSGKKAGFSILLCPDGKPYTELGQKRARRIYFPEHKATMKMLQYQLLTGQIK